MVVSVFPDSSRVTALPVLSTLRETTSGRMLGLAVVVVGLGLATSAWLRLVRLSTSDPSGETQRLARVRRATVAWCLPLLLAPPMFSRDGWSYAAQGTLTHLELSPYVWTPSVLDGPIWEAVDPMWRNTTTPYGPVPLLWGAVAADLTVDPWLLVIAHRLLALVGLGLLAYAVPRLAARSGVSGARASALVIASPLMMAHGVAGLHNDVLMVGLMAVALVVALERSWLLGAVLVGVASAVKLPAGLVGVAVVLVSLPTAATMGRRLMRLTTVGTVAVGTLVGVGVLGGLGVGWGHALGVPGQVQTPLSIPTQAGRLFGAMTGFDAVGPARTIGVLALVLFVALVAIRAPTGSAAAGIRASALLALAAVLMSPVVHLWYLLWCLPLVAVCRLDRRGAAVLLHVSWVGGLVAPLDSSLAGADDVIAVGVAVVTGTAVVQALAHRKSARQAERPASAVGSSALRR